MFISKIKLAHGSDSIWENSTYSTHQLLWSWFSRGVDDKRSFLYRIDGNKEKTQIITLSSDAPAEIKGWDVETRPYKPVLYVGEHLAFSLRVNPTVTRNGQRHDVVMDLKQRLRLSKETSPAPVDIIQKATSAWLTKRSDRGGFQIVEDTIRSDAYQRVSFSRKGGGIDFHQVDLQGTLCVVDPEKLLSLLYCGIGRARGFGCGLFLVRRA